MRFIKLKSVRDRPGTSCTSVQDELVVSTCTSFGFALLAVVLHSKEEELLLLSVSTRIMLVSTSLVLLLELLTL